MNCQTNTQRLLNNQQSSDQLIDNQLWSVDQLARYLNVPVATIRDWCYKRKIPFVKAGRSVRFKPSDVETWLNQGGYGGHK